MNDAKKFREEDRRKIYEIGYLALPLIEENDIPIFGSKIRSYVEENGGKVISEEVPKLRNIAYEIGAEVNSKRQKYNRAYFGWIKFELSSLQVQELKQAMNNESQILRFILVETVRENTIFHPKFSRLKKESIGISESENKKISEEEIDKSIEALIEN